MNTWKFLLGYNSNYYHTKWTVSQMNSKLHEYLAVFCLNRNRPTTQETRKTAGYRSDYSYSRHRVISTSYVQLDFSMPVQEVSGICANWNIYITSYQRYPNAFRWCCKQFCNIVVSIQHRRQNGFVNISENKAAGWCFWASQRLSERVSGEDATPGMWHRNAFCGRL